MNNIKILFKDNKYDELKEVYMELIANKNIKNLKKFSHYISVLNINYFNFKKMKINDKIHNHFIGFEYYLHGSYKKAKFYFKKYPTMGEKILYFYFDIKNKQFLKINKVFYYLKINKSISTKLQLYYLIQFLSDKYYFLYKKYEAIYEIKKKYTKNYFRNIHYRHKYIYHEHYYFLIYFVLQIFFHKN